MSDRLIKKLAPVALLSALGASQLHADTWSSLDSQTPQNAAPAVVAPAAPSHTSANQLLFTEIETLKQEIQRLQSVVEEQGYELKKLKTEQKERYLDLDRRLSALLKSEGRKTTTSSQGKIQYDEAFDLMKQQKLAEAATSFKGFLQQYPQSSLLVNAYYWLGQIYYNQGNLDEARKAFTIVVKQYPDHQKMADSKYKLGVVLHRLGDKKQAKQILQSVVKQFSDSATGRFAKKYLKDNF